MINIIIPSINRDTLKYTIKSLLDQTDSDWECWIGFDGFGPDEIDEKTLVNDQRIHYLYFPSEDKENKHSKKPGFVRNSIIEKISDKAWVGFVDDDDMLERHYVELVKFETANKEFDACVFRMRSDIANTKIVPSFLNNELDQNDIGISFIVNKRFMNDKSIRFMDKEIEQYYFLKEVQQNEGKIHFSNFVTYNVDGSKYCEFEL